MRFRLIESKQDEENFKKWLLINGGTYAINVFLDKFNNAKQKGKIKPPQNDYYYWIKNDDYNDFVDFMDKLNNVQSQSEIKKAIKEGAKLIYNEDGWRCFNVTTYEAMVYYGKGTKWCIAGNYPGSIGRGRGYFEDYLDSDYDSYNVVIDPEGYKWCVCVKKYGGDSDVWDETDDEVGTVPGIPEDLAEMLGVINEVPDRPTSKDLAEIYEHSIVSSNFSGFDWDDSCCQWWASYLGDAITEYQYTLCDDYAGGEFRYDDNLTDEQIELFKDDWDEAFDYAINYEYSWKNVQDMCLYDDYFIASVYTHAYGNGYNKFEEEYGEYWAEVSYRALERYIMYGYY